MTFVEIGEAFEQVAQTLEINFGYGPFRHGQEPKIPYLAFSYPGKRTFAGDNQAYIKISRIYIDLVTKDKDIDLEIAVEAELQKLGIHFADPESDFYQDLDAYVTSYETEELING